MTSIPRQALGEIVAKYGTEICSDARRCEGLLKDKCGSFRREISILINALEEHVPLDLLASKNSVPRDLLLNRLTKRLEDNLALTEEAAVWAVESWASALNIVTEDEIAKRETERAEVKTEVKTQENRKNIPNDAPQKQTPTARPPIAPPVKPKQPTIPFDLQNTQPSALPVPAGNALPQSNQTRQPSAPPPQIQPGKRSWKLRGCFFGCFLLLAIIGILFVLVPYSLKVMRETQQQSPPTQQRRVPPQ